MMMSSSESSWISGSSATATGETGVILSFPSRQTLLEEDDEAGRRGKEKGPPLEKSGEGAKREYEDEEEALEDPVAWLTPTESVSNCLDSSEDEGHRARLTPDDEVGEGNATGRAGLWCVTNAGKIITTSYFFN